MTDCEIKICRMSVFKKYFAEYKLPIVWFPNKLFTIIIIIIHLFNTQFPNIFLSNGGASEPHNIQYIYHVCAHWLKISKLLRWTNFDKLLSLKNPFKFFQLTQIYFQMNYLVIFFTGRKLSALNTVDMNRKFVCAWILIFALKLMIFFIEKLLIQLDSTNKIVLFGNFQ